MSNENNSSNKNGFWSTLPGILTGVAGIISAVAALIVGLNQAGLINKPSVKTPSSDLDTSQHTDRVSPTKFMRDYYTRINENKIGEAWQYLTPNFQTNRSSAYSDFYNWWNKVDKVKVKDVALISQSPEKVIVEVRISYYINGNLREEKPQQFILIWNEGMGNWQINDRVKL